MVSVNFKTQCSHLITFTSEEDITLVECQETVKRVKFICVGDNCGCSRLNRIPHTFVQKSINTLFKCSLHCLSLFSVPYNAQGYLLFSHGDGIFYFMLYQKMHTSAGSCFGREGIYVSYSVLKSTESIHMPNIINNIKKCYHAPNSSFLEASPLFTPTIREVQTNTRTYRFVLPWEKSVKLQSALFYLPGPHYCS